MAIREITVERHWTCSRRLRARRRALGLTQADVVARLGEAGVTLTNRALSTMENGRGLDLGWLPELAAALDCTVTYLLGLTGDPDRWEPDPPPRSATPSASAPPAVAHRNWILGPDPSGPDPYGPDTSPGPDTSRPDGPPGPLSRAEPPVAPPVSEGPR